MQVEDKKEKEVLSQIEERKKRFEEETRKQEIKVKYYILGIEVSEGEEFSYTKEH